MKTMNVNELISELIFLRNYMKMGEAPITVCLGVDDNHEAIFSKISMYCTTDTDKTEVHLWQVM